MPINPFSGTGISPIRGGGYRCISQLNALVGVAEVAPLIAAQYVAKRARFLAPVDTGYMRDHIEARKRSKLTADVVASAPYSAYVEYGTYKMSAQPFMRPAVDQGQREILSMTAAEINREIKRRVSSA